MNRKELEVEALLSPTVESLGCEIWGVEYLSQGKHTKLRVYIEREGGVDVDHCGEVSRHVSDLLDVEEFYNNAYTLEVSSPGMDRILFKQDQYVTYTGHRVEVRLNFPFEGRKRFVGLLAGVESDSALVQIDDDEFVLPLENIQRTRLVPEYEIGSKRT